LSASSSSATSVSGVTNTSTGASGIGLTTYKGTDGALQALNTTTFEAAFAADPNGVANLFTSSSNFVTQLATLLTNETGFSTLLASGIAGSTPKTSIFAGMTQQNSALITSAQKQIDLLKKQITNQANMLQNQYAAASQTMAKLQSQQSYLTSIGGSSSSKSG
jgi:flagellar capping protein FliD